MGKIQQVDSDFWMTKYNRKINALDRYFLLFLGTNPMANIAGVYHIPLDMITLLTGLEENEVKAMFDRFARDHVVLYRDNLVVVKDRKAFNKQDNPSIRKGIEEILKKAPVFARDFINGCGEFKEKKEGGSLTPSIDGVRPCAHPDDNVNDNAHDNDNVNVNVNTKNFIDFDYYMQRTYNEKTKKFLVLNELQKKDLLAIWEQLPDKEEIYKAWHLYVFEVADALNQVIQVNWFVRNYQILQQKLA